MDSIILILQHEPKGGYRCAITTGAGELIEVSQLYRSYFNKEDVANAVQWFQKNTPTGEDVYWYFDGKHDDLYKEAQRQMGLGSRCDDFIAAEKALLELFPPIEILTEPFVRTAEELDAVN